ncbi:OprD family outer membrane porin [Pseudomonas yamanorum]|uniref:OprD family outer membrane porin n=1 Tax=Pseudomonas yamanorum TaxID=515393 RepID=UPI00359CB3F1
MRRLRFGVLLPTGLSGVAHADFFSDSHATLETRNVYFNRDYDLNFERLGVPGLSVMSRYISGSEAQVGAVSGQEWERDTEVKYVIQSGTFKKLGPAGTWCNLSFLVQP